MLKTITDKIIRRKKNNGRATQLDLKYTDAQTSVIGNAIPKCGTYLLNSILQYLNVWAATGIHITDKCSFDFRTSMARAPLFVEQPVDFISKNVRGGQVYAAHLTHSDRLAKLFADEPNIRHIFMVRDPRDACISYMRYATSNPVFTQVSPNERVRVLMQEFIKNDDDRLFYSILRYFLIFDWSGYELWVKDPNTCYIKFEDLYTDVCGAKEGHFGPTLKRLFNHLKFDSSQLIPQDFATGVLGSGRTLSEESDKVKQYKRIFKPRHYELINNKPFTDLLTKWGYEPDYLT